MLLFDSAYIKYAMMLWVPMSCVLLAYKICGCFDVPAEQSFDEPQLRQLAIWFRETQKIADDYGIKLAMKITSTIILTKLFAF